jgi:hypothetical protein
MSIPGTATLDPEQLTQIQNTVAMLQSKLGVDPATTQQALTSPLTKSAGADSG